MHPQTWSKSKSNFILCVLASIMIIWPTIAKSAVVTYTYDNLNRLTNVEYDDGTTIAYTYDAAGNMLTKDIMLGDTAPPQTSASPSGNTYISDISVTLSANETATIYYTTDNSDPDTGSTVYASPISINANTSLKFFGVDTAGNPELINTETYIFDSTPIVISGLPSGTTTDQDFTVIISGNGVVSYKYQLDGGTWSPETDVAIPIELVNIQAGLHQLEVIGKDAFGNWQDIAMAEVSTWMIKYDCHRLVNWNEDLVADFGEGDGLKIYDGFVWNDLTFWGSVNYLGARSTDLIVNFGNSRGIYAYDSIDWSKISGWDNTVQMTVWNDDLVVDFGQGRGIYTYDTAWTKFCGWDTADRIIPWGSDLVIEFGSGRGTYTYDGSAFTKLCGWEDTQHMLTWSDDLVVDFGQGRGIYINNGSTWTKICGWDSANQITAWNDQLVVDFGAGRGIYSYDGSWNAISGWDTVHEMTAWGSRLVVDFGGGRGLYAYDGTWSNLSGWDDVEEMLVLGDDLIVDYGSGRGVYSYDGTDWTKLSSMSTGK